MGAIQMWLSRRELDHLLEAVHDLDYRQKSEIDALTAEGKGDGFDAVHAMGERDELKHILRRLVEARDSIPY